MAIVVRATFLFPNDHSCLFLNAGLAGTVCQLKLLQLGHLPNAESKLDGVSFVGRKSPRNSLSYNFTDPTMYQMLNYTNAKR